MPRTPAVDFECPTCHHKFGDVTKLRRHTMAMYGCWPRLNEGSTRYRLAIPSDTERAWYEDRVMREREARSGQRDVAPRRSAGSSGGASGVREDVGVEGAFSSAQVWTVRLPRGGREELHLGDQLPSWWSSRLPKEPS